MKQYDDVCSRSGEFNNDNWKIVGMHMLVRANIQPENHASIIQFYKKQFPQEPAWSKGLNINI